MNEKLYDIPIDSPLTKSRRNTISKFLADNANLFPMEISHTWHDESEPVLRLLTKPVTWEARFHKEKVEVFGSGPKWAALLFTKKRRQEVREHIESVLRHAGLNTAGVA